MKDEIPEGSEIPEGCAECVEDVFDDICWIYYKCWVRLDLVEISLGYAGFAGFYCWMLNLSDFGILSYKRLDLFGLFY